MRHLLSLVLGVVLAPAIYLLSGFSFVYQYEGGGFLDGDTNTVKTVLAVLFALIAGGLYALLVMARISPIGPVLVGVINVGLTAWGLIDLRSFMRAMPDSVFGVRDVLTAPIGVGLLFLAVPLLLTLLSPRRWRTSASPAGPTGYVGAPVYPTPAPLGGAAPVGVGAGVGSAPAYSPSTGSFGTSTSSFGTSPVYTPPSSPAASGGYIPPSPFSSPFDSPAETTYVSPPPRDDQ